MIESKFIEMLRTFSSDELKSFDDFISSPFYNKKKTVIKLYRNTLRYSPEFNHKGLDKRKMYYKLYPGKEFNDKIMRNIMSELVQLGEKYLEVNYYERQTGDKYIYLLNELLQKRLYKNFEKNLKSAKEFFSQSLTHEENYYNLLSINVLKHSYMIRKNPLEKIPDLQSIFDPLLAFFSIYFFKTNYNIATRQYDYNYDFNFKPEIEFTEKLMEYIGHKKLKSEPIIRIYHNMLMLIVKFEDNSYFKNARELVQKYNDLFNKREIKNFQLGMLGYCRHKIIRGENDYKFISFEIYKEMLDKKTYSSDENEIMLPLIFKNIVKSGSRVNQFDWTANFIEEYKNKLTNGFDINLYNFSYSYLFFKKEEYNKSLTYLAKVHYENVYDKLDLKSLLIQLYYEMDSFENLVSQLDAFKHFLQNDKLISNETKKVYKNFVNFVRKISYLKLNRYNNLKIDILKKDLTDIGIYDKSWLFSKICELEKRG